MRLLQLHTDFIEYEPISEELNDAEKNILKLKIRLENLIVVFVSVEKGDNKITIEKAIEEIKSYSENLKVDRLLIYPYSHLSSIWRHQNMLLKFSKNWKQNQGR